MSKPIHTIDVLPGTTQAQQDRIFFANLVNIANVAGGSAGASVTTAVAVANLPANYTVTVTPNQDCTDYVINKTQTGFSVVLTPHASGVTLAAGTFDVVIFG